MNHLLDASTCMKNDSLNVKDLRTLFHVFVDYEAASGSQGTGYQQSVEFTSDFSVPQSLQSRSLQESTESVFFRHGSMETLGHIIASH